MVKSKKLSEDHWKIQYISSRKDTPFSEWLEMIDSVSFQGRRSTVVILELKGDPHINNLREKRVICKIPNDIGFSSNLEHVIASCLSTVPSVCFCPLFQVLETDINPRCYDDEESGTMELQPFVAEEGEKKIPGELILYKFVDSEYSLSDFLRVGSNSIISCIALAKHIIAALDSAYKICSFTHYDLHTSNILVKRCNQDVVFLYSLGEYHYLIPSYGYYPIIIDYGFSYTDGIEKNPAWSPLLHTETGQLCVVPDWTFDARLLLVTMSNMLNLRRREKEVKVFQNLIDELFLHPDVEVGQEVREIDHRNGWNIDRELSIIEELVSEQEHALNRSVLFKENPNICFEILKGMILLPLEEREVSTENPFPSFIDEWCKLESVISSSTTLAYILKNITMSAHDVRAEYVENRELAQSHFQYQVYSIVDKVAKFVRLDSVDTSSLLHSMYEVADWMECRMYQLLNELVREKEAYCSVIPVKNYKQLQNHLDNAIPDTYIFTQNTKVLFFDAKKRTKQIRSLSEKQRNSLQHIQASITRGKYLYESFFPKKVKNRCFRERVNQEHSFDSLHSDANSHVDVIE